MLAAARIDADRPKRWRSQRKTPLLWTWTRVWLWHASRSSVCCWWQWSYAVPKSSWTPTAPYPRPPGRSNTWTINESAWKVTYTWKKHSDMTSDRLSYAFINHPTSCFSRYAGDRGISISISIAVYFHAHLHMNQNAFLDLKTSFWHTRTVRHKSSVTHNHPTNGSTQSYEVISVE